MIGKTLLHYEVTARMGAGGMGEVYRATDTKLGREVAIKVLPAEVAKNEERLARFRREARVLAALNHPRIASIHGLEEADGQPFLVMELASGEDLKQRLERGPIPVGEAVEIAKQIAEALREAHERGIVHRDLKPANTMLGPEGGVKLLDFGLARAWGGDGDEAASDLSSSPTEAFAETAAGVILGTVAYMSPEQASGKPVDKRSDIWSFGVVLFEMLTGRRPFAGETASETLASVIKDPPPLESLPATCPPALARLLRRCLRKDPRERLQDIGDARLELEEANAGATAAAAPDQRSSAGRWQHGWAGVAVAFALGALVALTSSGALDGPEPRSAVHFVLDTPEEFVRTGYGDVPAISPDGESIAFTGMGRSGANHLWVRRIDAADSRLLPGTEGARFAFWSPDGEWIAFFADTDLELRRIHVASGDVRRICTVPPGTIAGGFWGLGDVVLFAIDVLSARIYTVPAAGGEARLVTTPDASVDEASHEWPQLLPDGRHFIFTVRTSQGGGGPHVASLEAPDRTRPLDVAGVAAGAARMVFAGGRLLFVRDDTLYAQPFDADRLLASGEPFRVAQAAESWLGAGWFSANDRGGLSYVETSEVVYELVWFDRAGERIGSVGEPNFYRQIALSPDGSQVAVEVPGAAGSDIWVVSVARGVARRITSDPANERDPVWSPDGQQLAYASDAGGDQDVLVKDLRAGTPPRPLPAGHGATPGRNDIPDSWLRDGNALHYLTHGQRHGGWALPMDEGADATELFQTSFLVDEIQVSPDGQWLAYWTYESGTPEVYVQPRGRSGGRVRVSTRGGVKPLWRGDGGELFYQDLAGDLLAVEVREGEAGPEVGLPESLFDAPTLDVFHDTYAVSADGERFLVMVPVSAAAGGRIHVLLDWSSLID